MGTVYSVFYLAGCAISATLSSSWIISPLSQREPVARFLIWFVTFCTAFFGGFHILGFINLATDLPVVNPFYGSVIVLLFAIVGFLLWPPRQIPALLKTQTNVGELGKVVVPMLTPNYGLGVPITGLSVFTLVLIAVMLTLGFPRGYEVQAYHLPIGLHIFQTQSLKVWDTANLHTFPANASIYFGFLLGFVSEHVVAASGLVFLAPLAAAVYGIGRATGADETASVLAALGLVTVPIIAFSAFELGADVGGAAFLAVAVYFALAKGSTLPSRRGLCGLAVGLAIGFKSLHMVGAAFLFCWILFQAWGHGRGHLFLRRIWSATCPAVIFSVFTVGIAGFWLTRNYLEFNNPLYPLHWPVFSILGWIKAPDIDYGQRSWTQFEWVRSPIEWLVYPWVEWHYAGQNFKHSSGLGPFFAATVPVACLSSLIGVIKGREKERPVIASLLLGGIFVLVVWWVLGDRQPRYFMGSVVFLVPLVAWMVSQAKGQARRTFEAIIGVCILTMLFVIFSKQSVEFGTRFVYARQFTRQAFYQYPGMVDRLPRGSTVVNLGERTSNYALFGKGHHNRVVSYTNAIGTLGLQTSGSDKPATGGHLSFSKLKMLGATHLFVVGFPEFSLDECLSLLEIDRMDKLPSLEKTLPEPRTLYEIKYCT